MSNPGLEISVASKVKESDIGEMLSVDLSKAKVHGSDKLTPGKLGWISVFINRPLPDYGIHTEDYRFKMLFECAHRWNSIRLVLAMSLCEWLGGDNPGVYLVTLSTGDVLFKCTPSEVLCNKKHKKILEGISALEDKRRFIGFDPI